MTWGRFFHMAVTVMFNGPRNSSVRHIIVQFDGGMGSYSILRFPETEVNTIPKYSNWALSHDIFGKDVIDALWLFCSKEYGWA
jgi:hypothetical protein